MVNAKLVLDKDKQNSEGTGVRFLWEPKDSKLMTCLTLLYSSACSSFIYYLLNNPTLLTTTKCQISWSVNYNILNTTAEQRLTTIYVLRISRIRFYKECW